MFHIFKYRMKCMLKNRALLFWTLAFPMALTTLFAFVLRDVYHNTPIDTIQVAVIDSQYYENDTTLQTVMKEVKIGDKQLFQVNMMKEVDAKEALTNDEVAAIIKDGDEIQIEVKESDITTTILATFFEEYKQQTGMMTDLIQQGVSTEKLQALFAETTEYIQQNEPANTELDAVFFYTVLAMNCLFGGYWSINAMHNIQANQSTRSARMAIAPIKKEVYLFVDFILCMLFELVFVLFIYSYMRLILNIAFGEQTFYILLNLLIGAFAGNATGTFIGVITTKEGGFKTGILTAVTMFGSFLAGMMMIQIKYYIQVYMPWLNYINPVAMITDGLYALYYFGVGERYFFNIISVLIYSILGYAASFYMIRKRQYKSLEAR